MGAALASGCSATVDIRVDVVRSGHGSVTLEVQVPQATATQVADLKAGLPVADLRQAGWVVAGPGPGPAGSTLIIASHAFTSLAQVPVLVADIAGSGPIASRPFRLAVDEHTGVLEDRFTASGAVNLDCSIACFDDPRLAQQVGYPLGVPPAQLARLLGPDPDRDITFGFQLSLPGRLSSDNATRSNKSVLVWMPSLGRDTPLTAATESVNLPLLRQLLVAVSAGALVVLATAAAVLVRRRRRRGVTVTAPD